MKALPIAQPDGFSRWDSVRGTRPRLGDSEQGRITTECADFYLRSWLGLRLNLWCYSGLSWPPLKINLYVALGLALKAGIAHGCQPVLGLAVIFEPAILHGFMETLAHVVEHDPGFFVACDGKTHTVGTTLSRHMATAAGITHVAEVAQLSF